MSLRYALLALLARESLTGYDLTKRFDSTIGFFWSARHSQIYPELAKLTGDGLVTFELVPQNGKPDKKVYTITSDGHHALQDWVSQDTERRSVKDPLLMRIWTVGLIDPKIALRHLKEADEAYTRRGEFLKQMTEEAQRTGINSPKPGNPWFGPSVALDCGRRQHEAYHAWIKATIALLENMPRSEE